MSARIVARQLVLEELITVLTKEHEQLRKRLAEIHDVLARGDYSNSAQLVSEFDNSTLQHIVDEENVLLKLFVDAYGREGADDAIRVFQQHRTMHKLADAISKTALNSPEKLGSMPTDFDKLVRSHFEAEENRIFPWALKTHQTVRNKQSKTST